MQITSPERLVQFKNLLQQELFPVIESAVGPLSKEGRLLAAVISMQPLARFVKERRSYTGRPPSDRVRLATAFFAKTIFRICNRPAPDRTALNGHAITAAVRL